MRCSLFVLVFFFVWKAQGQAAADIILELKTINKSVTSKPCNTDSSRVISNRAMNIFLADKTGYLSDNGDLSFYTNYVTLNSLTGSLTINHNFQKAREIDEPIKSLFSVGAKANIANNFNTTFIDKKLQNKLGITLNQIWLGKVKTKLNDCIANQSNQKQAMDALRAALLHTLEIELNKRVEDFKKAIALIDSAEEVPGQTMQAARVYMQQNFYTNLAEEYRQKFASLQAEMLTNTNNFKTISTHWTSLLAYLPLAFGKYNVASTYSSPLSERHPYNPSLAIAFTQLWESSKIGRLFVTVGGSLLLNNSVNSLALYKSNITEYKSLGGTDTIRLASLHNDEVYIGNYQHFLTPAIKARVVYFMPASHVGLSFLAEQSLGKDHLLNGKLGIPIILINSKKTPAVNFEFQVSFFDMTHEINVDKKFGNRIAIGVACGIPFSRLMY